MTGGRVSFSLSALLSADGGIVPRERYQDPKMQQNQNGSWFIRPWVDVITDAGLTRKKKTIVLGPEGTPKRELLAMKREVMQSINRASYVIQAQVRFADLVAEFRTRYIVKQSASTQGKYDAHLKNHIVPAFGSLQLHEITALRVDTWLQAKKAAGLSWSTRNDIRGILASIFERAREWKLYQDDNPIAGVKLERKKLVREKRKLTDDQTRKLLAALPGDVRLMCCVALFGTLRISEVLGLQEKHLDFTNGLIHVRQRFYRGDLDEPKSEKAKRDVPMGYLGGELSALCMGDPERFVFKVRTHREQETERYSRDDRDILQHFVRPAAVTLGFYWPGFGWHSLRREAVTALSAELGIGQAMALAGHSTADMSLAYTLADRERQEAAIRARQERLMIGEPTGDVQ